MNSSTYYTAEYIKSWSQISSQLSVWDYTANYAYNSLIPNPDWFTVVPDRQFEHANGVVGYYAEGSTHVSPGRDLSELWIYLNAKAMWNTTSHDSEQLISHFLGHYYGAAAPHVYEYMQAMVSHSAKTGQWCHDTGGCSAQYYSPTAGFLTPTAVLAGVTAFERARAAVAADPKLLTRVDRAKLPALFVLLLRWDEIKGSAEGLGGMTWPPATGACGYNLPCAHQYVCKYQSCMLQNGRLIPNAS